MNRSRKLFGIAILAAPALAIAGPPFLTDDPVPVDLYHWEFYLASQYQHNRDGISGTLPHFELNYGAAPNLQLHVIAPFAYNQPRGGSRTSGYGDTELGLKYRVVQETKSSPQIGVFPLVELPTGSESRGLGSGQTQFFLPVWLQKTIGEWTTYGGGGFWHNPGAGNRDYWLFGWQAQRNFTKQLAIGAEVFHSTPSAVGEGSRTGFNVGAVYDIDEGHHLMFSVGRDFGKGNVGTFYLAYQWTFGPKEPEKK